MSDIERLQLLTKQMHLEPAEDCHLDPLPPGGREAITVKNAIMPNGQRIKLLKTLLSSYCEKNCLYCPFRAQRDMPRAAFKSLWDDVQSKGFWTGYVKNQRKGGGHYWVYATVLRSVDKHGNTKYVSIRIKPSREDIKKALELYATLD
jgi:hypothetical protein